MGVLDDAIKEHLDLKRRRGADPAEIEKAEREALGPVRRDRTAVGFGDAELTPAGSEPAADAAGEDFVFAADAEDPTLLAPPMEATDPDGTAAAYVDDLVASEPSVGDEFDLPDEGPIAAMPPEPEDKPKRRHLFHFRSHHHDDTGFGAQRELPAELPDDDPFLDPPPAAAAPPVVPPPVVSEPAREFIDDAPVGRDQPVPPQEDAVEPPPALQIDANPVIPESDFGRTVEYDVERAFAEEDQAGDDILEETPDFLADTPDHDRLWFEQKPPPDFDFDN